MDPLQESILALLLSCVFINDWGNRKDCYQCRPQETASMWHVREKFWIKIIRPEEWFWETNKQNQTNTHTQKPNPKKPRTKKKTNKPKPNKQPPQRPYKQTRSKLNPPTPQPPHNKTKQINFCENDNEGKRHLHRPVNK